MDGKVRSVWLKLPIASDKITKTGKPLTQHKYIRRGIEQVSLLEEAFEETTSNNNEDPTLDNNDNSHNDIVLPNQN